MPDFYGTTDGYKAYWAERNPAYSPPADASIAAALLVASEWIDSAYRAQFAGLKVGMRAQVREWPRNGVQDIYGYAVSNLVVPPEVESATYEAALKQLTTPGIFYKDFTNSKYSEVSISGAIAVKYQFGSASDFQTQMPQIAAILDAILTGSGNAAGSVMSGSATRV